MLGESWMRRWGLCGEPPLQSTLPAHATNPGQDSPNLVETFRVGTCLRTVRMPNPTLRSLAKELGLSRTTVSDALRGSPRVKQDTIKRVIAAAEAA